MKQFTWELTEKQPDSDSEHEAEYKVYQSELARARRSLDARTSS